VLVELRHQVRTVRRLLPSSAKARTPCLLEARIDAITISRRGVGQEAGKLYFFAIAEVCFSFGKLGIKCVEGLGASVSVNKYIGLLLGKRGVLAKEYLECVVLPGCKGAAIDG
jgi:hypothetical protein